MPDRLTEFVAAWPLFAAPALTALWAGALLGGLGTFVLLGRMVFVSAALGQLASLGVATGLGLRPWLAGVVGPLAAAWSGVVGAVATTTLGGLALALQARLRPRQLDALLGLLFAGGSAGTLVLASRATADLHDIHDLLLGSAVAVPAGAEVRMAALLVAVLLPVACALPALGETFVDPLGARVRGLPTFALQAGLLVALTGSIAYTTQVLGALPVFAFCTAPALAALQVCRSLGRSFVLSTALGAVAGFGGYVAAYALDWPVGATQALVACSVAALAHLRGTARSAV